VRLGPGLATGSKVQLLEPFPDCAELAVRVVDVLMGRLDPVERMLAEGDDPGLLAAAELAFDTRDDLLERLREPVCLVPADEASGVDGDVEGVLELAKAHRGVPARTGRQRQQARVQVLVVQRLLDQEIGERLCAQRRQSVAELAPRRRPRRLTRLLPVVQPGEAHRHAVLAEKALAPNRAGAGAGDCSGGEVEAHAVALRTLHAGPD